MIKKHLIYILITFFSLAGCESVSNLSEEGSSLTYSSEMQTITLKEAEKIAEQEINQNFKHKMMIESNKTKEVENGWIFYYDSERAVETGDWKKYGIPGNLPLFVGIDGHYKYLDPKHVKDLIGEL